MHPSESLLPPYSHTGVEPAIHSWGWWAGTCTLWDDSEPEVAAANRIARGLAERLGEGLTMGERSHWYQSGLRADSGTATVYYAGVGSARGTLMVSVRQGYFERVSGLTAVEIAALLPRFRPSRIDLTADDHAADRPTPASLYARLPAARSRSRPASRVLTVSADGAEKLTIGARSSERYVRIYLGHGGTRHEVECKAEAARAVWGRALAGVPLPDLWRAEYARVVEWL